MGNELVNAMTPEEKQNFDAVTDASEKAVAALAAYKQSRFDYDQLRQRSLAVAFAEAWIEYERMRDAFYNWMQNCQEEAARRSAEQGKQDEPADGERANVYPPM